MKAPTLLRCPRDGLPCEAGDGVFACAAGHRWPLRHGVVDLVPAPVETRFPFGGWRALLYDWALPRLTLPLVFGTSRAVLGELHARVAPQGGAWLDAPCGTGLFFLPAAAAAGVRTAIGVDLSPAMLARAARRGAATLVRADLGALPIADGAVDVVTSVLGLQFVPDRAAALREARRVLRPGGLYAGAAPALGLHPRYDRRHARRRVKDHPLDVAGFPGELRAAGFGEVVTRVEGALVLWEAR